MAPWRDQRQTEDPDSPILGCTTNMCKCNNSFIQSLQSIALFQKNHFVSNHGSHKMLAGPQSAIFGGASSSLLTQNFVLISF